MKFMKLLIFNNNYPDNPPTDQLTAAVCGREFMRQVDHLITTSRTVLSPSNSFTLVLIWSFW